MVDYRPRGGWTDTVRGGALLVDDDLEGVAIHYPGRPAAYGTLSVAQEIGILQGIRSFHVRSNGWADFGYQLAIFQSGRVWDCRGISRVPAAHASTANPRANWRHGAVLFVVGNTERPSSALVEAWNHFRTEVWLARWPRATDVRGHRQVPGASTACPGDTVIDLIVDGTLLGQSGRADGSGSPRPGRPAPGPEIGWPLPAGHYFGPAAWGRRSVSGHYGRIFAGRRDHEWLREWTDQLVRRGWPAGKGKRYLREWGNDGRYGPEYAALIRAFQRDQGLRVDGLLGPITWAAAYRNPVT